MAAQTKEQWMESMAERLTCTVCLEIYNEPVTLPCGHTLCKGCIKEWSSASQQTHWVCPLCKREDAIVYVERLDVNIIMKNLCKEYKDSLDSNAHGANERAASAQSSSKIQPTDHCQYHPNEEARFLCTTCKDVFCAICSIMENKHTTGYHEICTSKDAVKPVTEICNNTLRRICETLRRNEENDELLTDKLSSLSATTAAVKKHGSDLKTKLCQLVDRHISTLLLPIGEYERTNGASISHLQQLHNELLALKTSFEQSDITEVNVITRANKLFPLLERVNDLNSLVESYSAKSVQDPPHFQHSEEINETLERQIKKCCGLVQQQEPKRAPVFSQHLYGGCANESHQYCQEGKASSSGGIHQQPNQPIDFVEELLDWKLWRKGKKMYQEVPKEIKAMRTCSITLPSDSCKFDRIGWVGNHMFFADCEVRCIWAIELFSGHATHVSQHKYDGRYKPYAVSAYKGGHTIFLAVNVEYEKSWNNVMLYKIEESAMKGDVFALECVKTIQDAGYVCSLTADYVCYGKIIGGIYLYSLRTCTTIRVIGELGYQEVYLWHTSLSTTLYAVKQPALLLSWEVKVFKETVQLTDFRSNNFDCLSSIGKIRGGENLYMWLLDTNEKMLVCIDKLFWDIKYTIYVTCVHRIYDICISDSNIFLLAETDSGLCVTLFPLPHMDGSYTVQAQ